MTADEMQTLYADALMVVSLLILCWYAWSNNP